MCAPQEPPHHFLVVVSDMFELNENAAFVNPADFGIFDNVFVDDAGVEDVFDLSPLDNSFDLMDYDPSLFDLLYSYELPLAPSNMEPPPYSESSPVDWDEVLVGGLSADGSTYTPTFPSYDHFMDWSPPAFRLEDMYGGLSSPASPLDDNDEEDLLAALEVLYEPDDEERRGLKRKIEF